MAKKVTSKKPHEWQKDDALKADWLQSATESIVELQKYAHDGKDCDSRNSYGINTIRAPHNGNAIRHRDDYNETNMIIYRDHDRQTADLEADDEDGYYGNVHHVLYAEHAYHEGVIKTTTPDTKITDKDTVIYTEIITDIYGTPRESRQVEMPVGSQPVSQMWDIKTGQTGKLYIPTATTISDPINEGHKIAVRHRPHVLPALPQDNSYVPPQDEEHPTRNVQGTRIAQSLRGNTIPIKGLNNHGGVKFLGDDAKDPDYSLAMLASIEMYGICSSFYSEGKEPQVVEMTVVGTDEHGNPSYHKTEKNVVMYEEYNSDQPYRTKGDGILAQWPVFDKDGSVVSELTLEGGHFEDWQLWFKASGGITLPEGGSLPDIVHTQTEDYRTTVIPYQQDSQHGLLVTEFKRTEHWGEDGKPLNRWTEWEETGTTFVEFDIVGTATVGSATDYRYSISHDSSAGLHQIYFFEEKRNEIFGENGEHKDTWTEWEASGSVAIEIPVGTVTVGSAKDYRYDFSVDETGDDAIYLHIFKEERVETFGVGDEMANEWSDWQAAGSVSMRIPIGQTESYELDIQTLVGTPSATQHSHWEGNKLVLYQMPIFTSFYPVGSKTHSFLDEPVASAYVTGYMLV